MLMILTVVSDVCGEKETFEHYNEASIMKSGKWEPSPQAPAHICSRCYSRSNSCTATIIIASGSMGSTWLGQLLHLHPCTSSFRLRYKTGTDGKFRGFASVQQLASIFDDNEVFGANDLWERGPRGVIISLKQVEQLRKNQPKLRKINLPITLKRDGIRIIVLTRDPFFWAVSKAKKRSMLGADGSKLAETIGCNNRHQRGSDSCKNINESFRFSVVPPDFEAIVRENEIEQRVSLRLGKWLASIFQPDRESSQVYSHKNVKRQRSENLVRQESSHMIRSRKQRAGFKIVRYEDLLCRSKTQHDVGALTPELLRWIGVGKCTNMSIRAGIRTGEFQLSVKSSPENPLRAIINLDELKAWAASRSKFDNSSKTHIYSFRSTTAAEKGAIGFSRHVAKVNKSLSQLSFKSFEMLLSNRTSISSQIELSQNCKTKASLSDNDSGRNDRSVKRNIKNVHEASGLRLISANKMQKTSRGKAHGNHSQSSPTNIFPISRQQGTGQLHARFSSIPEGGYGAFRPSNGKQFSPGGNDGSPAIVYTKSMLNIPMTGRENAPFHKLRPHRGHEEKRTEHKHKANADSYSKKYKNRKQEQGENPRK